MLSRTGLMMLMKVTMIQVIPVMLKLNECFIRVHLKIQEDIRSSYRKTLN